MKTRSVLWGALGSTGMAGFYVAVIVWANGWSHLGEQIRQDWYFLVPIIAGFGIQVALMVELRARHRMGRPEATAGATGAGSSAVGMLACCAHHLAEIAPLVGATAAATFLANYRIAFMVVGITLNAVGITVAARKLHHSPTHTGEHACMPA